MQSRAILRVSNKFTISYTDYEYRTDDNTILHDYEDICLFALGVRVAQWVSARGAMHQASGKAVKSA
jgi:hypothetical protein